MAREGARASRQHGDRKRFGGSPQQQVGALLSPQQKNRPPAASMRRARRWFSSRGGRGQSPAVKSVAGTL